MIKYNGYYLSEPVLYQERKECKSVYFIKAYLFLKIGITITASKYIESLNENQFNLSEFNEKNGKYDFIINDDELCLKEQITPERISKFYYDKVSDEEFTSRQNGDTIKFTPFN